MKKRSWVLLITILLMLFLGVNYLWTEPTNKKNYSPTEPNTESFKGVFSFGDNIALNDEDAAKEVANWSNKAAEYGFNILQVYDPSWAKITLNKSEISGQTIRNNKQKVWVPVIINGGALPWSIGPTETEISFFGSSNYTSTYFNEDYYSNKNYKTMWLDDECIQFKNFTKETITYLNRMTVNYTFYGLTRGCEGTIPQNHPIGSIPVNTEYLSKLVQVYNSNEMKDAIAGYYAIDDSPNNYFTVDYTGMQKIKNRIIRSIDPDLSRPIIYGQMAFDLRTTPWLAGTLNFTYVDAIAPYVYPWRMNYNLTESLISNMNITRYYFSLAGKEPNIIPVAQAFSGLGEYKYPTEYEMQKEIDIYKSLDMPNMMFFRWPAIMANENDYAQGLTQENWKKIIRNLALGDLTSVIRYRKTSEFTFEFDGSSSTPGHGPIINYTWFIADKIIKSENITYNFASYGNYPVTLEIRNDFLNESANTTIALNIRESENSEGGESSQGNQDSQVDSNKSCQEQWTCGDWFECVDSMQVRNCKDLKNCGTVIEKPETARQCTSNTNMPGREILFPSQPEYSWIFVSALFAIGIIALIILIATRIKKKK